MEGGKSNHHCRWPLSTTFFQVLALLGRIKKFRGEMKGADNNSGEKGERREGGRSEDSVYCNREGCH